MKKVIVRCMAMFLAIFFSGCSSDAVVQNQTTTPPAKEVTNTGTEPKQSVDNPSSYNQITSYMEEESKKAFSPYYELLEFTLSDYEEKTVDGKVEAMFGYQVKYKNFEKDPDTVDYIKAAKEKNDPNYQQLYDEYLQPKDMSFHLKAVVEDADSITLYTNVSPKGVQWEKAVMSDFILKK
ncbi:hypothetical protein DES34_1172 [Brevibacillus brevis]|nr:hypothetical protein DES34_1172 [Brevibacillus brevis]GEC91087.1 hypothetical protein BBR01nite_34180 [Brevibacillus brevis]VEF86345.1 Uncharacterised protein [Brevibacillus brevis]